MTQLKPDMLKKGKKGFTLTELAIVIAVIAILIAVLVPTFTSMISKAKVTAAAENATSAITAFYIDNGGTATLEDNSYIVVEYDSSTTYYFKVTGGAVSTSECLTSDSTISAYLANLDVYTFTDSTNEVDGVTIYYVSSTTASATVVAKTTAETALSAFSSEATYSSNTALYILVDTYWFEVSGETLIMLGDTTASTVSTSVSSADTSKCYYNKDGISTSDTDALATIYYSAS